MNDAREYAEYAEYFTATTGLEPMSIEDWRKQNDELNGIEAERRENYIAYCMDNRSKYAD